MNKVCCNQDMVSVQKGSLLLRRASIWRAFVAVIAITSVLALVSVAHAADWYVDVAVLSSGDGRSWDTAFKTIDEGINAANDGDTIFVKYGTYNERLVIDKQLTLTGFGLPPSIVQPTDAPAPGIYDVEIDASGTIIEHFRFDFNGADDTRFGNGMVVSDMGEPPVTNVEIRNNEIYTGHGNTGIQTGKNSDVSGLIITENVFYGDSDGMGEGVYINPYGGSGKVTIRDNEFYGYLFSAVSVEAGHIEVAGNIIDSNTAKGVYGVRFIDLTGGENYANVVISHNDIRNVQYGISVGTSSDVGSILTASVDANTLSINDIGLRTRYGSDLTVTRNAISGNADYGIYHGGTGTLVAENNWWGNFSGPYHPTGNPDGTGDTVGDNVDFDPWITSVMADFSGSPTSGAAPLSVQFTDLSVCPAPEYYWEFGDDETSTEQNPIHEYQSAGDYTVRLTVTGPAGADLRGKIDYIHVIDAPPIADFSANPTSGTMPLIVQFTDLSTGDITEYYWEFGDDETSTDENPVHEYQSAGYYTVRLTVTGPGGSDVKEEIAYIHVSTGPVAHFSGSPTSGAAPLSVQFTDLSSGDITDYYWDFGDGETSADRHPLHEYQSAGDFTVTLTVTGPGGSDVMERIDYIHVSAAPIAEFSASPTSGVVPLNVTFTDQSTGTINTWEWDFNSDTVIDSTDQNPPPYTYDPAGTYTVALTVTGPGGSDSETKVGYITVSEVPPVAAFSGTPTSGVAPLTVTFTDESTGPVDTWEWDFNDDGVIDSTDRNPAPYTYDFPGAYTVTLKVTGPGGSDLRGKIDYIRVPPVADFLGDPTSGIYPLLVHFTDKSTGEITDYYWEFGDEKTSTAKDPVNCYVSAGDYTVRLTVAGPGGSDVKEIVDYIHVSDPPPEAYFTGEPTHGMIPLTVQFTDLSAYATDYYWEFGDGETSADQHPFHEYQYAGDYAVKLTVSGPGGSDSMERIRYVLVSDEWWARTHGGHDDEEAYSIQQTSDGGYIVTGYTHSFSQLGDRDFWVLKLDLDGIATWQKTYGWYGDEYARCIQQTADGGYIVAGNTAFGSPYDIWVLKLKAKGGIDWQKKYGGYAVEDLHAIQQTTDGGYILAGSTATFGGPNPNLWVLKLNADGTVSWQYGYRGQHYDYAYSIHETADGGYIVAGATYSFGTGGYDMWVLKLGALGTVSWQKTYGGVYHDYAYCVRQTLGQGGEPDGYIIAGHTNSFGAGGYDIWVLRLNDNGTVAWERTYGGSGSEEAFSIQQTADGGYIVAGRTDSFGAGGYDIWVLKLNADGTVVWEKTYGGQGEDQGYCVQQTTDGGYIVAGSTDFFGAGNYDFLVLRLDENGEIPNCNVSGTSDATVADTLAVVEETSGVRRGTSAMPDVMEDYTTQNTVAETFDASGIPVIDALKKRPFEPRQKIRIKGSHFGPCQNDSVVHIGNMTFDSSSPRIKLWTDNKIRIKIPYYKCKWFKGEEFRFKDTWVTVNGIDSNKKHLKVMKPDTCP